jgi:hypothetical protein
MQSSIVYSVNCKDCEQKYVEKTDRQAIRRMKEHGAPSNAFGQQTTAEYDTDDDKLRRSSQILSKKADLSKLPNTADNIDDWKVVLLALLKHQNDTDYHINRRLFL